MLQVMGFTLAIDYKGLIVIGYIGYGLWSMGYKD